MINTYEDERIVLFSRGYDFDKTLLEKTSLLYGLSERETSRQRFENRLETSTRLFEIEDGGEVHENFHGRIDKTFPR